MENVDVKRCAGGFSRCGWWCCAGCSSAPTEAESRHVVTTLSQVIAATVTAASARVVVSLLLVTWWRANPARAGRPRLRKLQVASCCCCCYNEELTCYLGKGELGARRAKSSCYLAKGKGWCREWQSGGRVATRVSGGGPRPGPGRVVSSVPALSILNAREKPQLVRKN